MKFSTFVASVLSTNHSRDRDSAGNVGERTVKIIIDNTLNNHRLINNIILLDNKGKSHQIDHIYIAENGIFCIETKNYKGLIRGRKNDSDWIEILNKRKYPFINPLNQNNTHIVQISNILKQYGYNNKINSLIVFVYNNALELGIDNVINVNNLREYLINYNDGTKLSNEDMDNIYTILCNSKSNITKEEHINNIKNK